MSSDRNNPDIRENERILDYQVERITELEAVNAVFYELRHLPTGARHVHISREDSENAFSVAFKTVPADSTGVAHILEHTVLCGSEKFPVRDPFFSMLKRSLSTFMNAFTASDWTMYPFCTQNRTDFYNLLDVYLDAAFYPRLDRLNFKQEGHRLEFEGDQLSYKGVVYNEMKGAMSSPNQVMVRSLLNALYPDTTYGNNSGGEPAEIPKLSHEQLKAFHQRHYHPSNAFFYTYGDLPLAEHLAFIQEKVLSRFGAIDPETDVPAQPRWDQPRELTYTYPLSPEENTDKRSQVCMAWLTADVKDAFECLALTLLEQILLGNAASPLRKALIDSELGSALSDGTGFDADNRDTMFSCGLKETNAEDAPQIAGIIQKTLSDLAEKGIDKELVDTAIHQIEFHRKEVSNSPYPYGLKLMLTFIGTWLHHGDPVKVLRFDADMARLRELAEQGGFFERKIQQYFLDNPHQVLFKLVPDPEKEAIERQREEAELADIQASLSPADVQRIQADAKALAELQEAGEDLSVLPRLELSEIPHSVHKVQPDRVLEQRYFYEQPTAGICYFSGVFGAGNLPAELVPLVPFFTYSLSKMGTQSHDYAQMARNIAAHTGGLGLSANVRTRFESAGDCTAFVSFNAKCLDRKVPRMFELMREFLGEYDFSDPTRLKSLLLQYRAALESSVVQNGHRLAISLASRNFSPAPALSEIWNGIHQLKTIKALSENLDSDKLASLAGQLSRIGAHLFARENLKTALVGEAESLAVAEAELTPIYELLSPGESGFVPPQPAVADPLPREGWYTSTAVSFVASAFETVRMEAPEAPVFSVISKILRALFLHREIREKGGAYGGFSLYNVENGLFCFASYRDPRIVNTLKVYQAACRFIRSNGYDQEDVKEAILQVCSDIDKPDPPGPAARKAFFRHLIGLSDAARERFKERLLAVDLIQVREVADQYFDLAARGIDPAVAVISGESRLKAANEKLTGPPLELRKI